MNRVTDFRYNDIVLYSKHWYEHSDDIVDDLGYIFSKIYAFTPKTEHAVARMMLQALDCLYKELDIPNDCPGRWYNTHFLFEDEVDTRMSILNVSRDMAVILLVLNIFSTLSKEEIRLNCPVYGKKEHFRMGSMFGHSNLSMTYKEMNRIAKQTFAEQ